MPDPLYTYMHHIQSILHICNIHRVHFTNMRYSPSPLYTYATYTRPLYTYITYMSDPLYTYVHHIHSILHMCNMHRVHFTNMWYSLSPLYTYATNPESTLHIWNIRRTHFTHMYNIYRGHFTHMWHTLSPLYICDIQSQLLTYVTSTLHISDIHRALHDIITN